MIIGSNLQAPLAVLDAGLTEAIRQRAVAQSLIIEEMARAAELDKTIEGFRRAVGVLQAESNRS